MTDIIRDRIALQGFTKEAQALVREAEELGWTFRRATHGVMGRSPDGTSTLSIGRKSSARNRAYQNAQSSLNRWKREQEQSNVGVDTSTAASRHIVVSRPWKTSSRVVEQQWSDGHFTYVCAYPDCGYTAYKARAVSGHYGNLHTVWKNQEDWPPTAAEEAEAEIVAEVPETEPAAEPEPEPEYPLPLPDPDALAFVIRDFIAAIVPLVVAPLMVEREGMLQRMLELEREHDLAVQRMTKMKYDLKALSGLLDEID